MRYEHSKKQLRRALSTIPLASQTFSKAYNRWPREAPHFLSHGKGGRVWDIDGNEYVDLVGGLLPNVLGYCDPDVDQAIQQQLKNGISFSLPTVLESVLAERLVRLIPCADMVRFGKTGTDATSAAVRLARAATGRDHVIMCGYHGWQDWSIGQADDVRNRAGVPQAVRDLSHLINPFRQFMTRDDVLLANVAALIVDCSKVPAQWLKDYRKLTEQWGAILIFDEIITGFRYDIGGAQKLYGVTPDLACFSKAMGNGMPISAIVGRRELMEMFDHVFFSGTFGGETLSLAAAIACIDKIERENVCQKLAETGNALTERMSTVTDVMWYEGHPSFRQLKFGSEEIREAYLTAMLQNGVLVNTSLNVCFAHDKRDVDHVSQAHQYALGAAVRKAA